MATKMEVPEPTCSNSGQEGGRMKSENGTSNNGSRCRRYWDGPGYTAVENSSIFSLI